MNNLPTALTGLSIEPTVISRTFTPVAGVRPADSGSEPQLDWPTAGERCVSAVVC
jgi:hypothetical protein